MRPARVFVTVAIILAPFSAPAAAVPFESSPFAQVNPFFQENLPSVQSSSQTAASLRIDVHATVDRPPFCGPVAKEGNTLYYYRCSTELYPEEIPQLKTLAMQGEVGTKNKCLYKKVIIDLKQNEVEVYLLSMKPKEAGCDPAVACKGADDPSGAKTRIQDANGTANKVFSNCEPGANVRKIEAAAKPIFDANASSASGSNTTYKPGGALTGKSGTLSFDNVSLDSSLKDPFPVFPQSFSQTSPLPPGQTYGSGSGGTGVVSGEFESFVEMNGYQEDIARGTPDATGQSSSGASQNTGALELIVAMQMGQLLNSLSQGAVNPPPPPPSQGSSGAPGAPAVAQIQSAPSTQPSQGITDAIDKLVQATGNAVDAGFNAIHDTFFSRGEAAPNAQAGQTAKTQTYVSAATAGNVTTYTSVTDSRYAVTPVVFFNGNGGTPTDANAKSVYEQAKASGNNVAVIVPAADCNTPANCVGAFTKKDTAVFLAAEAGAQTQLAIQGPVTYVAYSGGYAQLNAALQNCEIGCPDKIIVVDGYGVDNNPQNPNTEAVKKLAEWVKAHPGTSLSYECTSSNTAPCNTLKANLKASGVSFDTNAPASGNASGVHVYEAPPGTTHANALQAAVNGQNGPVAAALRGTTQGGFPSASQLGNANARSSVQFNFGKLVSSDGRLFLPQGAAELKAAAQTAAREGRQLVVVAGAYHDLSDPSPMGGKVKAYTQALQAIRDSGAVVAIIGDCTSACADVSALAPEGRLYATPEAKLKLHLGELPALGPLPARIETLEEATKAYPDSLKKWINDRGGLTREFKDMTAQNGLCAIAKCVDSLDDIPASSGGGPALAENTKPPATDGCVKSGDSVAAMFTDCIEIGGKQVYGGTGAKRDDVAASKALAQGSAFSTDLPEKLKNLTPDQIAKLQGRRVLINMGTNDPQNIKTLCANPGAGCPITDSIRLYQKYGVDPRNIDVIGINNKYGVNDLLEKAAKAGGANYVDGSKYYTKDNPHLDADGPKKILADIQNGRNGSYSTELPSGAMASSPPPSSAKALFADGRYNETFKKIEADSGLAARGVPGILNMFGNIEGTGGNCNIASFSGPLGCFQYTKTTWQIDSARMNGGRSLSLDLRRDLEVSAKVTASSINYYIDTHGGLIRSSGINPYAGVYAFHNIGKDGAQKFLRAYSADPNTRVRDVLDWTTINNNRIIYRGGNITLAQVEQNMLAGMNRTTPPSRIAQPASSFTGTKVFNNGGNAFKKGSLGDPFVDDDYEDDEWVTARQRPKTYRVNYGNNPFSSESLMKMMLGNMLGGQLGNLFKGSQTSNTNQQKQPNPAPPPTTLSLSVQPTTVVRGKNITVGWSSDATLVNPPCQVTQNGAVIATGNAGGKSVTTSSSTPATLTFTLMCKAAQSGEMVRQQAVVNVQ